MILTYGHRVKNSVLYWQYDFLSGKFNRVKCNGCSLEDISGENIFRSGWIYKIRMMYNADEDGTIRLHMGYLMSWEPVRVELCIYTDGDVEAYIIFHYGENIGIDKVANLDIGGYQLAYDIHSSKLLLCGHILLNSSYVAYAFLLNHDFCFDFCKSILEGVMV